MDKALDVLRRFCSWIAVRMVTHPGLYTLAGLLVVVALSLGYSQLAAALPPRRSGARPRAGGCGQPAARRQADRRQSDRRADRVSAGKIAVRPRDARRHRRRAFDPRAPGRRRQCLVAETLRRWLAEKLGKTDVATLKQYVDMLPPYLTRRFISAKQDAVIVNGRVPDADASKLLPIVDELDKKLGALKAKYPGYTIAVTGLSVIAARNSAIMIDKLSRRADHRDRLCRRVYRPRLPFVHRHADQHLAGTVSRSFSRAACCW